MTNPLTDLEAYTDAELKEATSVVPFSPAATLLSRVLILRVGTFFMWRRSSALTKRAKRRVTVYRGYPLLNGCHACASAGFAIFNLNFNAQGKFFGTTLMGLTSPPLQ